MAKTVAAAFLLILILAIITTPCMAKVYQVGDEPGWTGDIVSGTHYAIPKWTYYWDWSWTKKFYVGDVLVFKYDNRFDSVLQVNQEDKLLCSTSNPIAIYNTGSDAVTLDAPGYYFFISGDSDHCWDGNQKLQVFVNPAPATPSMSVTPSSSMSSTPSSPAPTPAALLSSASPANNNHLSYLVYAAAVAAFLVIV